MSGAKAIILTWSGIVEMNDKFAVVVGYPKSGNTWMARLLGQYLDSPVSRWRNAIPLAAEGADRNGEYFITQLHLKPSLREADEFVDDAGTAAINAWAGEKVVFVARDPRDVAVSAMHYWELPNVAHTIRCMRDGTHPLFMVGSWESYVRAWLETLFEPVYSISYEHLRIEQENALFELLKAMGLADEFNDRVILTYERERFGPKRQIIEGGGERRPYGKGIQLKNMRKGIVGDWVNWFTEADLALANEAFGDYAREIGYWWSWDKVPDKIDEVRRVPIVKGT
jgi:hypothetical protein